MTVPEQCQIYDDDGHWSTDAVQGRAVLDLMQHAPDWVRFMDIYGRECVIATDTITGFCFSDAASRAAREAAETQEVPDVVAG